MPPTMTAAIITLPESVPAASIAVPNTYAALLNGPPMSIDIMPPTMAPRSTRFVVPMLSRTFVIPVLIAAKIGLTVNMTIPMARMPSSG